MTLLLAASIAVVGAFAAVVRYLVTLAFPHDAARSRMPWGVLVVNAVGSFIGGIVLGLASQSALSHEWQLILLTGFCGGLTTFSTFSVETLQLIERRRWRTALLSVTANLVIGIALAVAGYTIVAA